MAPPCDRGKNQSCTAGQCPQLQKSRRHVLPERADSGFRRGTDILKGLALGADFILLGRQPEPTLPVLSVAGKGLVVAGACHRIPLTEGELS